jgi:hypothetical protein
MTTSGRARLAIGLVVAGLGLLTAIAVDASRRRREADPAIALSVVRRLPSSDLALSGGARWLRSPSLEEPSAAFDLGPAMPDPDPAGGLVAPPREVWRDEALLHENAHDETGDKP